MDDIKEIKADVKTLLQQGAVHNEILRTHESRSLALQKGQEALDLRIKPVEMHVNAMNLGLKLIGLITVGVLIQAIIRVL